MNRRDIGSEYEDLAVAYLKAEGYEIVQRNFRCRMGEIDVIAKKDGYLRFVEVKYRKDSQKGEPGEAVDRRKQKKICKTASFYLLTQQFREDFQVCFDVVTILGNDIRLYPNAFEYIGT